MSNCGDLNSTAEEAAVTPTITAEGAAPVDESTPPSQDEGPTVANPAIADDIREYYYQFNTPTYYIGADNTIERRPDAVTSDYLRAFTEGPIALGDPSQGLRARIWYVIARYDEPSHATTYYLAGANASNDGWEDEVELVTFIGRVDEIDCTFGPDGRIYISSERNNRVWLYYWDGASYIHSNLDDGRTPKVTVVDPDDLTNTCVVMFYIKDILEKMVWRDSGDDFAVLYEHDGKVVTIDHYIEEAFKTIDSRTAIMFSKRNRIPGRYSLERLETYLLPLQLPAEGFTIQPTIESFELVTEDVCTAALSTPIFRRFGVSSTTIWFPTGSGAPFVEVDPAAGAICALRGNWNLNVGASNYFAWSEIVASDLIPGAIVHLTGTMWRGEFTAVGQFDFSTLVGVKLSYFSNQRADGIAAGNGVSSGYSLTVAERIAGTHVDFDIYQTVLANGTIYIGLGMFNGNYPEKNWNFYLENVSLQCL